MDEFLRTRLKTKFVFPSTLTVHEEHVLGAFM